MPALDYATLYLFSMVSALSTATAMFYIWRAHRRDPAARLWFYGFLTWALTLFIFGTRGILPPLVSSLLGNLMGVGALTLLYLGTARFIGRLPAWRLLIPVYGVSAFGIFWWSVVDDAMPERVACYSLGLVTTIALMVRDLWNAGEGPQKATYRFVAFAFGGAATATMIRTIALLAGTEITAAKVGLPLAVWFMFSNAANVLGCIGYLLMVSQRLQQKNNWARIEELFHETLRLAPEQRAAHLKAVCEGDAVLLAELESLVQAAEAPDGWMGGIDVGAGGQQSPAVSIGAGTQIGAYRVQRLLGQGGMGEVYGAELSDGSSAQPVALKLLRPEASEHLERFRAEQRIAAQLVHPGIARVFDGGVTDGGRPYMVLEYIQGESITSYCRRWHLPLRQRLKLFIDVCEAVSYAHAQLVVHRDLKPTNILVTDEGRIKLLDFGVAKLLNPVSALMGEATVTQAVPFTPEYAAPEQLEGRSITQATDVYSLGVLLFELLTDELPWQLKSLPASVALHKVLHESPRRASEAATGSRTAPVLARLLRKDLDAIIGKALKKLPRDRYLSVRELQLDLERHLSGKAIGVRPDGLWYRFSRYAGRHIASITVATALLILASGFVAGLLIGAASN